METRNLLKLESSRMEAFRLLSDCYRLPDQALIEKIRRLEMHMVTISEQSAESVQRLCKEFENTPDIELLKIDFSKLFVGPYNLLAPPYGSVYLEGERKIMGDSTLDVISRFREAGLQTSESFKDAPDHISAELEFMYYLIFKELEAFSAAELTTAIGLALEQKAFLENHLVAWVPQFAVSIKNHAENPFYPHLAETTEIFLENSYELVCGFLDAVQPGSKKPAQHSFESISGLVSKYQPINTG